MQQKFMEVLKMSEIERINRYIERTKVPRLDRYELGIVDAKAIKAMGDMLDAVYAAFLYGRAKGYRAAMSERKAVRG